MPETMKIAIHERVNVRALYAFVNADLLRPPGYPREREINYKFVPGHLSNVPGQGLLSEFSLYYEPIHAVSGRIGSAPIDWLRYYGVQIDSSDRVEVLLGLEVQMNSPKAHALLTFTSAFYDVDNILQRLYYEFLRPRKLTAQIQRGGRWHPYG